MKWKKGKVMLSKDSIISSLKLSKVLMLCVYVKRLSDIILFFTMKYLYQNQVEQIVWCIQFCVAVEDVI